jgi:hypothetical protein
MNRISFKGSNAVIRGLVSRILDVGGGRPQLPERARERYEKRLDEISDTRGIDRSSLDVLFDFLIAHGATKLRLDRLTGECEDELVQLAHDVEILRRFRLDGTITDIRIIDEWPF